MDKGAEGDYMHEACRKTGSLEREKEGRVRKNREDSGAVEMNTAEN